MLFHQANLPKVVRFENLLASSTGGSPGGPRSDKKLFGVAVGDCVRYEVRRSNGRRLYWSRDSRKAETFYNNLP